MIRIHLNQPLGVSSRLWRFKYNRPRLEDVGARKIAPDQNRRGRQESQRKCVGGNNICFFVTASRVAYFLLVLCPQFLLSQSSASPDVLLLNKSALVAARAAYQKDPSSISPSLWTFLAEAKTALKTEPVSVVDKNQLPPSGDKHDYFSLAPYWWPDSTKPDGLPYIRRDGQVNPERHAIGDRDKIGVLSSSVYTLSVAYFITGDETFAAHAVRFLRTWFLNPETRMNPNLTYAQAVKGRNEGRGIGIIDTHGFVRLIDGLNLLKMSKEWTKPDDSGIKEWFKAYLRWLRESPNGKDEADAKNNHGSVYDVQTCCYALLLGKEDEAREILLEVGKKRIAVQVEPDGSQPLELERTKAYNYSLLNLEALINLARLGERLGVDLWSFEAPNGGSIRKAIEFLIPYTLGKKEWKWKQIVPFEYERMIPILRIASKKYGDPSYAAAAKAVMQKPGTVPRANFSGPEE